MTLAIYFCILSLVIFLLLFQVWWLSSLQRESIQRLLPDFVYLSDEKMSVLNLHRMKIVKLNMMSSMISEAEIQYV